MFRLVGSPWRILPTVVVTLAIALALPLSALANVALTQISSDPYTNSTSQHKTQVEPVLIPQRTSISRSPTVTSS